MVTNSFLNMADQQFLYDTIMKIHDKIETVDGKVDKINVHLAQLNGQQSRNTKDIANTKLVIDELQALRWKLIGAATLVSTLIGLALQLFL